MEQKPHNEVTHQEIHADLRKKTGTKNNTELMNYLQDRGMVSDNAITIEDVADSDLMLARNQLNQ